MAAKAERRKIGDHDYQCSQLTWGVANEVFARLLQSLGPAVGNLVGPSKSLLDVDVGPAIARLASDLRAEDVEFIVQRLMDEKVMKYKTSKGGFVAFNMETWNVHFTGHFFNSLRLLRFALEVNYGDFLDGVRAALKDNQGAPEDPASSNSDSPQA